MAPKTHWREIGARATFRKSSKIWKSVQVPQLAKMSSTFRGAWSDCRQYPYRPFYIDNCISTRRFTPNDHRFVKNGNFFDLESPGIAEISRSKARLSTPLGIFVGSTPTDVFVSIFAGLLDDLPPTIIDSSQYAVFWTWNCLESRKTRDRDLENRWELLWQSCISISNSSMQILSKASDKPPWDSQKPETDSLPILIVTFSECPPIPIEK